MFIEYQLSFYNTYREHFIKKKKNNNNNLCTVFILNQCYLIIREKRVRFIKV